MEPPQGAPVALRPRLEVEMPQAAAPAAQPRAEPRRPPEIAEAAPQLRRRNTPWRLRLFANRSELGWGCARRAKTFWRGSEPR